MHLKNDTKRNVLKTSYKKDTAPEAPFGASVRCLCFIGSVCSPYLQCQQLRLFFVLHMAFAEGRQADKAGRDALGRTEDSQAHTVGKLAFEFAVVDT